jgi:septal ring factor EnvC (AmiA/AmiB activator)
MRRALLSLLAPLAASLLLAACGVSDGRYKEALDQVALQAREAKAQRQRADALAGRVEHLEQRVAEAERARRALSAEAAASRARAETLAAARVRLESELDVAIAEAHRAQARLTELSPGEAEVAPWLDPSGPVGAHAALLRSAGLCVQAPRTAQVSGSAPAAAP